MINRTDAPDIVEGASQDVQRLDRISKLLKDLVREIHAQDPDWTVKLSHWFNVKVFHTSPPDLTVAMYHVLKYMRLLGIVAYCHHKHVRSKAVRGFALVDSAYENTIFPPITALSSESSDSCSECLPQGAQHIPTFVRACVSWGLFLESNRFDSGIGRFFGRGSFCFCREVKVRGGL